MTNMSCSRFRIGIQGAGATILHHYNPRVTGLGRHCLMTSDTGKDYTSNLGCQDPMYSTSIEVSSTMRDLSTEVR
jgi:hypothetical protein